MDKKYLSKLVLPYAIPYINKSTEQYVILDGTQTTCQLCGYTYNRTLEGVSDHIKFHSAMAMMVHKKNVYCQKQLCLEAIGNATYIMDNSTDIETNVIAFGMLLYAKYSMYVIGNFMLGSTGSIVSRERYYSEYIVCNKEYVPDVARDIINLIWRDDTADNRKAQYHYEFYNFSLAAFCDELAESDKPKLVKMASEMMSKLTDEDLTPSDPIFNEKALDAVRFRKPSEEEIRAYEATSQRTYGKSAHNKSSSKMKVGFEKKPEPKEKEQHVKEETPKKRELSREDFQKSMFIGGSNTPASKKPATQSKPINAAPSKPSFFDRCKMGLAAIKKPVKYTGKAEARLKAYIADPKEDCDLKIILLDYVVELENRIIGYYKTDMTSDEQEELMEKVQKARMLMGRNSKPTTSELKSIL